MHLNRSKALEAKKARRSGPWLLRPQCPACGFGEKVVVSGQGDVMVPVDLREFLGVLEGQRQVFFGVFVLERPACLRELFEVLVGELVEADSHWNLSDSRLGIESRSSCLTTVEAGFSGTRRGSGSRRSAGTLLFCFGPIQSLPTGPKEKEESSENSLRPTGEAFLKRQWGVGSKRVGLGKPQATLSQPVFQSISAATCPGRCSVACASDAKGQT